MSSSPGNATAPDLPGGPFSALPSLTNTYGALLISTFLALALYGLTIHQTYRYYRLFSTDITFHRLLVPVIFIADTFHSITLMHICYHYLVQNYFDPFSLLVGVWTVKIMPLTTGSVVLLCQAFYLRRVFVVDRRYRWISVVIAITMLLEFACFISATVYGFKVPTYQRFSSYMWIDSGSFCIATVTDVVLMIVFVVIVRSRKTSFRGTRRGLDRLAVYAVVATLLNTALTLPAFITSIVSKNNFIYLAMAIPTTKVYTNGVLAFLNLRLSLHESTNALKAPTLSMSTVERAFGSGSAAASRERVPHSPSVVIDIRMSSVFRGDDASGTDDGVGADGSSAKHPQV